jgi:hypothetical protein
MQLDQQIASYAISKVGLWTLSGQMIHIP